MLSLSLFLALGFIGSGHCVGMCGPFVVSYTQVKNNPWYSHVLYGLGRSTTYAFLGFLASSLGHGLQNFLGFRASILVVAGLVMLYMALGQLKLFPRKLPSIQHWRFYQKTIGRLYASDSWYRTYPLGVFLGFIPCGLTAIALSLTITQSVPVATLGMFIFGLGTMPAMVGFGLLLQRLKLPRLERYMAGLMAFLGFLTLWMGLHRLGVMPQPPQSALLMRLHPTSVHMDRFDDREDSAPEMPHQHH